MARIHTVDYQPDPTDDTDDEDDLLEFRGQTFKLVRDLPGSYMLRLGTLRQASNLDRLAHIQRTINALLDPDARPSFWQLVDETDPPAPLGELVATMNRMVEIVSDRPTSGQQPSPAGLPTTSTGSTDNGDSEPATPAGSAL